ncbi:MAG: hypothetical protein B1H02_04325 [Candidatus Latescibacteria bacterium 4484_107]|nr:MAG: hypothetical protein B1H02_04325 [Candidatus Latescibacteria bacterium 4484_107]
MSKIKRSLNIYIFPLRVKDFLFGSGKILLFFLKKTTHSTMRLPFRLRLYRCFKKNIMLKTCSEWSDVFSGNAAPGSSNAGTKSRDDDADQRKIAQGIAVGSYRGYAQSVLRNKGGLFAQVLENFS